jgi:hypothetical protein
MTVSGASGNDEWPNYAPRCPPPEMAVPANLQHPLCGGEAVGYGPRGAMVMSLGRTIDVETTASIDRPRQEREDTRSPM